MERKDTLYNSNDFKITSSVVLNGDTENQNKEQDEYLFAIAMAKKQADKLCNTNELNYANIKAIVFYYLLQDIIKIKITCKTENAKNLKEFVRNLLKVGD